MIEFPAKNLSSAIASGRYEWRHHALKRILKRKIRTGEVLETLKSGEIIEEYLDDFPFPAALFLGKTEGDVPLHVVVSYDEESDWAYIVTVYFPDSNRFEPGGRERKRKIDE